MSFSVQAITSTVKENKLQSVGNIKLNDDDNKLNKYNGQVIRQAFHFTLEISKWVEYGETN